MIIEKINLLTLGLIFDIIGVLIITLVTIFDYPHQRVFGEKEWWKRYYWEGWRPIFRIDPSNEKARWKLKWGCFIIRYGFIPPNYKWNIIGFLYILIGFILQLIFYSH